MRGILWKWLLFLGFIFWISLCASDYYRKNIELHPEYQTTNYIQTKLEETVLLTQKKVPPGFTFWKTLSMIVSVSALIYIKRSSTLKKQSRVNVPLSYSKPEIEKFATSTRIINNTSVFHTSIKELKKNQLYVSEPQKTAQPNLKTSIPPGVIGVEIVQKKLESLEKSVANLKERRSHIGFSPSAGIVSGSPEFRKFLSSCQTINTPIDSITDISLVSSHLTESIKDRPSTTSSISVPQLSDLLSPASSVNLVIQPPPEVPDANSKTSSENFVVSPQIYNSIEFLISDKKESDLNVDCIDNVSVKIEAEVVQTDSSWSTISGDPSGSLIPEVVKSVSLDDENIPTITEIFEITPMFCKSSKTSIDLKISEEKFIHSTESSEKSAVIDTDDDLSVPGSNLISTSRNTSASSIRSTSTLMSTSTVNITLFESSCLSFEDDALINALD